MYAVVSPAPLTRHAVKISLLDMIQKQNDMGTAPVGRLLLRLALPAICAQLINALYNIVDRMYIGHIPGSGALALTGVGVTFPIIMLISAFSSLVGMGGAPLASIRMGEGKNDKAEELLSKSASSLIIISAILTVFFLALQKPLLLAFGASQNTLGYATDYLTIYLWGTIFVQLCLGLNPFITAQGFAKTSMMTVLIGAGLNIALDPLFIFVFGMGVKGAALATIVSQAVSSVWVVAFLCGDRTRLRIRVKLMRPSFKVMMPVFALGVAPFVMQSTESLVNIILNSTLQRTGGDIAVGAMTILSSVMMFAIMPLQGVTQGGQPIISFNFGAGQTQRVKKTFSLLLTCCLIYSTVLCVLVELFPRVFIAIFSSDPELTVFTERAMRIFLAGVCLMGAQLACQQSFIALGQAKISLFLALLRKIVLLIPLVLILSRTSLGLTGVFLAEPIADITAATTTTILFRLKFNGILARGPKDS